VKLFVPSGFGAASGRSAFEIRAGSGAFGRLGDVAPASRLAALLEEVAAPSNWSETAAEHVLVKLRS
jgi:hypothetical protein